MTPYWGDEKVDWEGIDLAANYISSYCRRYGRLGGHSKEKYGEIRFDASFGYLSLHTLIYPGYYYSQFPKWLWELDVDYIGPVLQKLFEGLFVKWQKHIYSKAYIKALKKWPHLRSNILCGADWPELIKGATRREGKDLHVLGLGGEILSTRTTF